MSLPPILTTTEEVARLADELARQSVIAVDLEADSMHNYREKVCLLQVSTPEDTVLIDPLGAADLAPLAGVLADPGVRKIFHAADYDIRCLHRDFGLEIRGLFDTMIASQFIGEEKVGLADVLNKYFSVSLDKAFQRADWSQRPLPADMIRYAAEDTRHLHRLAAVLEERLQQLGRHSWAAEEFALLEKVRHAESEGPLYLRFKGAGRLDPRQLAALEGLLQFRDSEAQRRDCPLFKIVGNRALHDLARNLPRGHQGLVGIEGVSPRLADRYGSRWLKIIETALALPEGELPVYPRQERPERDPHAEARFAILKRWRKEKAAELGMDTGVLINNAVLEEISRLNPDAAQELEQVGAMKGWQRREFAAEIVQTLHRARNKH